MSVNYCPEHGDLLALEDRRSARCREAHGVDEIRAALAPPAPVDREKLVEARRHLDVIKGAQNDMLNGRPDFDAMEEIALSLRLLERDIDTALAVSPAPARDEWERMERIAACPDHGTHCWSCRRHKEERYVTEWLPVTEEESVAPSRHYCSDAALQELIDSPNIPEADKPAMRAEMRQRRGEEEK